MSDIGERHSDRRPATRPELVRPYVLSTGGSAHQAAQRQVDLPLAEGDHPANWTGDQAKRRAGEPRSDSTGRDAPAAPGSAMVPLPDVRSAASHWAPARARLQAFRLALPGVLTERRWLAIIGAGVVVLATVCVIFFLPSAPAKQLTQAPARAHTAIRRSHPLAAHSSPRLSPVSPRNHPTPHPTRSSPARSTPSPTSSPTASPARQPVKVSYTVVRQHPNSFQGQLTIVNDGTSAINGWQLVVVLPGDTIHSVRDALFHTNGDTLYIDPGTGQRTIAPGATLTENFTAHGSTTTLASCTFNGSAC